jgi:hypothetical protein
MTFRLDVHGYLRTTLRKADTGKATGIGLHRIMAATFIGPCPDGLVVNHIDGVKTNNSPSNLEYISQADNNRHAFRIGLNQQVGEEHHASKLTDQAVQIIRSSRRQKTSKSLALRFGVTESLISAVQTGKVWRHVRPDLIVAGNTKGASNGNSRLSESDVRDIRASTETIAVTALRFRVSATTIKAIRLRRTWKHID